MVVQLATRVDDDQAEEFREKRQRSSVFPRLMRCVCSSRPLMNIRGSHTRYEFDRLRNRSRMNGRLLISLMICR